MKALVFLAAAVSTVALIASTGAQTTSNRNAEIDRIIGKGEFNAVYPIAQADHDRQKAQYTARLAKVVELLSSRDVSDMPLELQAERARNLQRLREYRERGAFPVNYEHPDAFLPVFIDRNGAICAAGYLVEQSAGRDVAEAINREYKYATISQMSSPVLDRWIAGSGFSRAEIATIQGPSLSPRMEIANSDSEPSRSRPASRSRRAAIDLDTVAVEQPVPAPVQSEEPTVIEDAPAVEATIGSADIAPAPRNLTRGLITRR